MFRPTIALFTANDAVRPLPLGQDLDRIDTQLDLLIYYAFLLSKAVGKFDTFRYKSVMLDV